MRCYQSILVHFARLVATRHQAEIGADVARPTKALGIIDGGREGERSELADAGNGHQPAACAGSPGHLLHVGIDCRDSRKHGSSRPDEAAHGRRQAVDSFACLQRLFDEGGALFGVSQGAPVAIAYAVRHAERVSRLVLCGGFAQGWRKRGNASEVARAEASIILIREGWGHDNPAARQMFTSLIIADATREEMEWMNELERQSASPETAIRLFQVIGDIDVMDLLPHLSVPVLLLHSRGDARVPFEHGRQLAQTIPNACLVPLESKNHLILSHEPAFARFLDEVLSFLDEPDGDAPIDRPVGSATNASNANQLTGSRLPRAIQDRHCRSLGERRVGKA